MFTAFSNITGSSFVFTRNDSDVNSGRANWIFKIALPSGAGDEGHFGYATDISESHYAVGAYGYGKSNKLIVVFDSLSVYNMVSR